jgi:hypothetical protein
MYQTPSSRSEPVAVVCSWSQSQRRGQKPPYQPKLPMNLRVSVTVHRIADLSLMADYHFRCRHFLARCPYCFHHSCNTPQLRFRMKSQRKEESTTTFQQFPTNFHQEELQKIAKKSNSSRRDLPSMVCEAPKELRLIKVVRNLEQRVTAN